MGMMTNDMMYLSYIHLYQSQHVSLKLAEVNH